VAGGRDELRRSRVPKLTPLRAIACISTPCPRLSLLPLQDLLTGLPVYFDPVLTTLYSAIKEEHPKCRSDLSLQLRNCVVDSD